MENLSDIQKELFSILSELKGKPITAEKIYSDKLFQNVSLFRIKKNLAEMRKKDIGVDEAYHTIKSSGYCYSIGWYIIQN